VVYQRLEPVLRDVSEVQVDLQEVQSQLHMMNLNLEKLHSKKVLTSASVPADTTNLNYIKYIILINVTLAIFLFMLTYPLSYIPYAVTLIYLMWWVVITTEYKLWSQDASWVWVFLPILLLPIYTIIMSAYLLDYQLFGSLFIGLVLYITAYYSWATYLVKGILPLEIDTAVQDIKKRFETQQKQETTPRTQLIHKPNLPTQLTRLDKSTLRTTLISLACILFAVVWFGYALEHQLIGEANWQTIGIENFHWKSLYSYALSIAGILLLLLTLTISRGQNK
jgi:hypothetical protein